MKTTIPLPSVLQIIVILGLFLFSAYTFTTWFHLPIQLLLLIGWFLLIGLGVWLGHSYHSLEKAAIGSIANGMHAILILIAVGALIGSWIVGGIVPAIIYYGLQMISPPLFLLSTLLLCSLTSLATGTSWGSAATAGIAMVGIGYSLHIPLPLTAGAILSGVYFGDKLSPFSDSVILASTMSQVNIVDHIQGMLPISLISYVITALLFTGVGYHYSHSTDLAGVDQVSQALATTFYITPWALVPVAAVLFLLMQKRPAFVAISVGTALGVVWAVFTQDNSLVNALRCLYQPDLVETHVAFIDKLLSRGGIESMLGSIVVIILGLGFGGLLEKVGILSVITQRCVCRITHPGHLTVATLITAFLGNLFGSAMYVSLILTPTLMMKHYDRLGIARRNLSRNAEFGGTLTSAMVPWSDNGIFMSTLLGIPTMTYVPYMWLSFISIFVTIITAYSGKYVDQIHNGKKAVSPHEAA